MIGLENKDIKVNNIILKFSNNGKYLAIFLSELNTLKIYDIEKDKPEEILEKIGIVDSTKGIHWTFKGESEDADKQEDDGPDNQLNDQAPGKLLKFCKRIDFGDNDKYLLLFGAQQIMILDLEKKQLQTVFKLDDPSLPSGQYERLLDARVASVKSSSEDSIEELKLPYRC